MWRMRAGMMGLLIMGCFTRERACLCQLAQRAPHKHFRAQP
jgi:hypothetical protein